MTDVPAWSWVLDNFGRCLEHQEALVAAGRYGEVFPFTPPDDLGPLPAALELTAQNLLQRARALEAAVEQDVDAARRRTRLVRRMQLNAPRQPAFTEQRV